MLWSAAADMPVRSLGVQALTQVKAAVYYLTLVCLPHRLNVEHQFFLGRALSDLPVVLSIGLILSIFICRRSYFREVYSKVVDGAVEGRKRERILIVSQQPTTPS